MKLHEITNIVAPGNATTLSGGKLPNAYSDDSESVSKAPRIKRKDVYGGNGIATAIDTGDGDGDGDGAVPAGSTSVGNAAPAGSSGVSGGAPGGGTGGGTGGAGGGAGGGGAA